MSDISLDAWQSEGFPAHGLWQGGMGRPGAREVSTTVITPGFVTFANQSSSSFMNISWWPEGKKLRRFSLTSSSVLICHTCSSEYSLLH